MSDNKTWLLVRVTSDSPVSRIYVRTDKPEEAQLRACVELWPDDDTERPVLVDPTTTSLLEELTKEYGGVVTVSRL